jgi:hypothetical protein
LNAKLNGYLALERQWLIEDFKRLPPDVVLVDNLRDGWGAWAKADAELAQLLKPYVLVQTIEGIDILRRVVCSAHCAGQRGHGGGERDLRTYA